MTRWVAMVGLVLVGACGTDGQEARPGPPDTCAIAFRLDASVSADRAPVVEDAFAMWNGVSTRPLCLRDDGARAVRSIPYRGSEWTALSGGSDFIGITLFSGDVVIVDGLDAAEFRRVIQHEAGHVLGLGHVAGRAVMTPAELYQADQLTAADVAECRRVGSCD